MSNPEKRWSWGQALGRGVGGAIGTGATGALVGSLGGPLGVPLGGAIGAAGGFCSGLLGAAIGHWWDDPPELSEAFGSAALFTAVVAGFTSAILSAFALVWVAANPAMASRAIFGISSLSAFLASLLASLIDDQRARTERRRRGYE